MTSDDRDREIERFVAGLPVDEAAFAEEVARLAVQRTIVLEALLRSLDSPEATARLRAVKRVARMPDAPPEVVARLTRIAATDDDERVRAAGVATLNAHGLTPAGDEQQAPTPRRRALRALRLVAFRTRAADPSPAFLFRPEDRSRAPSMLVRVERVGAQTRLSLSDLPTALVGKRLTIAIYTPDPDAEPLLRVAAGEPVLPDGTLTVSLEIDEQALAAIGGWPAAELELLPDDD